MLCFNWEQKGWCEGIKVSNTRSIWILHFKLILVCSNKPFTIIRKIASCKCHWVPQNCIKGPWCHIKACKCQYSPSPFGINKCCKSILDISSSSSAHILFCSVYFALFKDYTISINQNKATIIKNSVASIIKRFVINISSTSKK